MAKGQRASTVKRNNTALRAKFAPIYDARTARLSAKLQEIAAQPKPPRDETMDVDAEGLKAGQNSDSDSDSDVDMNGVSKSKMKKSVGGSTKKRGPTRVMKKIANRKAKKSIVFERSAGKKKRLANDMARKKS